MSEVCKKIETAWECLSKVPVAGDTVEWMAQCRAALRGAYKAAQEAEEKKGETEHGR